MSPRLYSSVFKSSTTMGTFLRFFFHCWSFDLISSSNFYVRVFRWLQYCNLGWFHFLRWTVDTCHWQQWTVDGRTTLALKMRQMHVLKNIIIYDKVVVSSMCISMYLLVTTLCWLVMVCYRWCPMSSCWFKILGGFYSIVADFCMHQFLLV